MKRIFVFLIGIILTGVAVAGGGNSNIIIQKKVYHCAETQENNSLILTNGVISSSNYCMETNDQNCTISSVWRDLCADKIADCMAKYEQCEAANPGGDCQNTVNVERATTDRFCTGLGDYVSNDICGEVDSSTVYYDEDDENICQRDGYTFENWEGLSISSQNMGYVVNDGVLRMVIANIVNMYPVWESAGTGSHAPTSVNYVEDKLATVQDSFAGLGTNKLMTYPTTAGGTPGSRDIVTTLGTPNATTGIYSNTIDTTVATRGAINTGILIKQNTLHGTQDYVVTGTGTPGTLGEKAIYSAQNQFNDALVETGTVNTAVINAVNSELVQVNENGVQDSNGTLWQIADTLPLVSTGVPAPACKSGGEIATDPSECCNSATQEVRTTEDEEGNIIETIVFVCL